MQVERSDGSPQGGSSESGERVSNTLVTYPEVRHSSSKDGVIPDSPAKVKVRKNRFGRDLGSISLLVG